MDWTPSDYTLILCFGLATFLMFDFAVGRPRTWFRDRLGWVIFSYAVGTVLFVGLIAYAIVFGQKVAEPVRFIVGAGFAVALLLKIIAIHIERRRGRIAGERLPLTERNPVSANFDHMAAVKSATEIWYKAQRVLRTLIQTVIPSFLGFAVVLPMIIEAAGLPVDSELRLWLLAVAGGVTAVAAGLSRIMAIPAVNAWLIKVGLGSVPKAAVMTNLDPGGDHEVYVIPEVKLERFDG